jgi:hypothetical protein
MQKSKIFFLIIIFMSAGYFGAWSWDKFGPLNAYADNPDWKLTFSENVTNAFIEYQFDLNDDFTDSGAELAKTRLERRINKILFHYRNCILNEMDKSQITNHKSQKRKEM